MSEFKLVPEKMLLDKETIEAINFHCGDGDGDDSQFGEYSDGLLWVGAVTDDEGKEVYGLHLATAEYPEEGSTTLVEFNAPEDAAQSELAALREELAIIKDECVDHVNLYKAWTKEREAIQQRLTDAEQRNADAIGKLELAASMMDDDERGNRFAEVCRIVINALKPTESGASE